MINQKDTKSKVFSENHCQYRQRLDQLLASPLTGWDRIFVRDLEIDNWRAFFDLLADAHVIQLLEVSGKYYNNTEGNCM